MTRGTLPTLEEYRQSVLRSHATCPRRTRRDLQAGDVTTGWSEASGDLGTATHAVLAEVMRTLRAAGEQMIPTEEATVICWEVYNALDLTLPAKELETLEWMVQSFCQYRWSTRIFAIEEPFRVPVVCPDGVIRVLKGQPDLVTADPPRGLVCVDYKTGQARPKAPREAAAEGEAIVGKEYLSDAGVFQRQVYGFGLMRTFPAVQYVILRELPLRFPGEPPREARLERHELEHVEKAIASRMMKLDRGLREGPKSEVWKPRPGKHCVKCPVARSCPVPREMRGDGAILTQVQADRAAQRLAVMGAKKDQATSQLKAWQEAGNPPGRVNERDEVRWGPAPDAWMFKGGGRRFDIWPAISSVPGEVAA
jgi:RecB family exonuclease